MLNLKNKSIAFYLAFATFILCVVGLVFDLLSYFLAGYYKLLFGEDNSVLTLVLIIIALVLSLGLMAEDIFLPGKLVIRRATAIVLTLAITAAFTLMIFDRLEAIGNCLVSDYDAGYGGEEACYLTFVAIGFLVVGLIANIVGCGLDEKKDKITADQTAVASAK